MWAEKPSGSGRKHKGKNMRLFFFLHRRNYSMTIWVGKTHWREKNDGE
jgi:hypothetical protein